MRLSVITAKHHDKHRLHLISSPHFADRQNQETNTVHRPPYDCNIHLINTGTSKIGDGRTFPTPHWINHFAMLKYTIATLQAMVGAKLTGPIDKIHERPTFSTLCHLQNQISGGLRRVGNSKYPLDGHVGYILLKWAFSLFYSKSWRDPEELGEYYKIPVTAITETEK